MSTEARARLAGWAGVLFVVLSSVIGVASPFWPPLGAGAVDVGWYYANHRTAFLIGNYCAVAAAVPSFFQLAWLAARIRRAEGEGGWLWMGVLASGAVAHAVGAGVLIVYQAIPFVLGPKIRGEFDSPSIGVDAFQVQVAGGLSNLAGVGFALFLLALVGFAAITSVATYASAALPRWYAHLGVAVCALCGVGSFGAIWSPTWLAGGGLMSCAAVSAFFGWCLALALIALREARTAR